MCINVLSCTINYNNVIYVKTYKYDKDVFTYMEKVQLPKVKQKNRIELNVLKAQRDDTTLDTTLEYLLKLPRLSITTIERLNKKRQWIGDRQETDDELVNRFLNYIEEMPTEIIGRAIRNAMESSIEEIDTWEEFSEEFRGWLKKLAEKGSN